VFLQLQHLYTLKFSTNKEVICTV